MLDRRALVKMGLIAPALSFLPLPAFAADEEELLVAGPLGERALGNKDAKITMIEYASLTCGACKAFHDRTFKALKEKYIDTGKVYFIIREFNRDPRDTGAYMLAHCVAPENYFNFVDLLLDTQRDWARGNDPVGSLLRLSKQVGLSEDEFKACLSDQKVMDGVSWVRERGIEKFGVNATPTFFINGEKVAGVQSLEQLESYFNKYL